MSANIKCYDPASGRVLFDLGSGISRILGVIDAGAEQGEIHIPSHVIGGANLFVVPSEHNKRFYAIGSPWIFDTIANYSGFNWRFENQTLFYQKYSDIVLYYGLYV